MHTPDEARVVSHREEGPGPPGGGQKVLSDENRPTVPRVTTQTNPARHESQ